MSIMHVPRALPTKYEKGQEMKKIMKARPLKSPAPAKKSPTKEVSDKRFDNVFVESEAVRLKNEISQLLDLDLAQRLIGEAGERGAEFSDYDIDLIRSVARRIPMDLQIDVLGCVTDSYSKYRYIKKK